jgi:hypothetical protein
VKFTLGFDVSIGVCTIAVTGPHKRPDDSHELLCVAAAAAEEHGCSRFSFDMREAIITGGALETFETANDPEKHGFSRHYRIAAVYPEITGEHYFMGIVGVNRGASAFRVFDDINKAYEWVATQ